MSQRGVVIDDKPICGANTGRICSGNGDELGGSQLSGSTNVDGTLIGGGRAGRLSMCGTSTEEPNTQGINLNSRGVSGDCDGGV